jgi:hypothetical protein
MRKALSGILLGILSFMFIVTTAGSSNAADIDPVKANVKIVRVHYNSKGVDLDNNAWQEGVLIRNNNATGSVNLSDFRIRDTYKSSVNTSDWQDRFTNSCSLTGNLPAKETVYVTSSSVAYDSYARRIAANQYIYCDFAGKGKGHNGGIFNNMGDTAYVQYKDTDETQHTTSAKSYGFDNGYYVN